MRLDQLEGRIWNSSLRDRQSGPPFDRDEGMQDFFEEDGHSRRDTANRLRRMLMCLHI